MQLHTDAYLYQCSICRKAFKQASELVQHMKDHTGEKVGYTFDIPMKKYQTHFLKIAALPMFHLREIIHTARQFEHSYAHTYWRKGKILI